MLQKRRSTFTSILMICGIVLATILPVSPPGQAAEQDIDLDGNTANGDESRIETNVLQAFPVQIENVIHNNADGAFIFVWPGAGPGGFTSVLFPGPDVGTKWEWSTVSQVFPILSPATFIPTDDPRAITIFGAPEGGIGEEVEERTFGDIPGRSILPAQVTVSSASLTSSLITFFSPEETVATCGGSFANGVYEQTVTNNSDEDIVIAAEQQACCPEPQMTICNGECQFYLIDPNNCGGCGIECNIDEFCDQGSCELICPVGQTLCGEECFDLQNDPNNCGDCGIQCAWDEYCNQGSCEPICPEGQSLCGEECFDLQNDPNNCGDCGIQCAWNEFCDEGVCERICGEGETLCGEQCVDLLNDPLNCGECGTMCGSNDICTGATCETCRPPLQTACDNVCVNIHKDPLNCGGCGMECDFSGCPSEGQGACSQGESCICDPPEETSRSTFEFAPRPTGLKPRLRSSSFSRMKATSVGRSSPKRTRLDRAVEPVARVAAAVTVEEAPVCGVEPIEQVIPAGESVTQCQVGSPIGTEVFLTTTVQRDGETVAAGPCAVIVPMQNPTIPEFLGSAVSVLINDDSGDGLPQPGEAIILSVWVQNVGTAAFLDSNATLSSPPDEFNTTELVFSTNFSPYPDFPAFEGGGDCDTPPPDPVVVKNEFKFRFDVPAEHQPDVGRVFIMTFDGDASAPLVSEMPFVLGVGRACDPATDLDGETFDGLHGLMTPVSADLRPKGSPLEYSTGVFTTGNNILLRLRLFCGDHRLAGSEMETTPEIIALEHETLGPQSLDTINGGTGDPADPFFFCDHIQCSMQMSTDGLTAGDHVITIRMPDSRAYQAGFTISP